MACTEISQLFPLQCTGSLWTTWRTPNKGEGSFTTNSPMTWGKLLHPTGLQLPSGCKNPPETLYALNKIKGTHYLFLVRRGRSWVPGKQDRGTVTGKMTTWTANSTSGPITSDLGWPDTTSLHPAVYFWTNVRNDFILQFLSWKIFSTSSVQPTQRNAKTTLT